MTSGRYLRMVACMVLVIAASFILLNFLTDDFGLFWSNGPKRIWVLEKTSKYLLSYRYVPRHFEGLLIGPSHSDVGMDTRQLQSYRVYNLSMRGSNASEVRAATVNALQRGHFRFLIICLSPYLTKDSGMKDGAISPRAYWGSLFSLLPLQVWWQKLALHRHPELDRGNASEWGTADTVGLTYTWDDFVEMQRAQALGLADTRIDPRAFDDLRVVVQTARAHGVKVFGYFFPYNIWRVGTAVDSGLWASYQAQIRTLLTNPADVVWDMTAPEYDSFRRDAACYTDGHLSLAGGRLVLADIEHKLRLHLDGLRQPPVFPRQEQFACLGKPGAGSGYDRAATAAAAAD